VGHTPRVWQPLMPALALHQWNDLETARREILGLVKQSYPDSHRNACVECARSKGDALAGQWLACR
jgi:hypothetical protein